MASLNCTITEIGDGRLIMAGDITATGYLDKGETSIRITGQITGNAVLDGTPDVKITGTVTGTFTGALSATLHTFGQGGWTVVGTIGAKVLNATLKLNGSGKHILSGTVV